MSSGAVSGYFPENTERADSDLGGGAYLSLVPSSPPTPETAAPPCTYCKPDTHSRFFLKKDAFIAFFGRVVPSHVQSENM